MANIINTLTYYKGLDHKISSLVTKNKRFSDPYSSPYASEEGYRTWSQEYSLCSKNSRDPYSSPYESQAVGFLPRYKCKKTKSYDFAFLHLCPGKDLNLHELPRLLLRQVRLPISPPGHILLHVNGIISYFDQLCEFEFKYKKEKRKRATSF